MDNPSSQPRAVILLAGRSTRLYPYTASTPKCLLTVGDKPLLWYSINNLLESNVREFCFVVGFESQKIITFIKQYFPSLRATFIHNDRFKTTNSIYSYYLSIPFITHSNYFRLEGDLLYSKHILKTLMESKHTPVSAVERKTKGNAEEYSVTIRGDNQIALFGKDLPNQQSHGEAKGIEYIRADMAAIIVQSLRELIHTGQTDEYAEVAYSNSIRSGNAMYFAALDTQDFWCEIDTIEDLLYARSHLHLI